MPMLRRGQQERGSGTTRFFRRDCGTGWYGYSWTARPRRRDETTGKMRKTAAVTVAVRVCVVAGGPRQVFVCWGIRWDPVLVAKRYEHRFGIESSYRQLGSVLAVTTSTDERVRLLHVGVALLVRQYWCWVIDEWQGAAGEAVGGRRLFRLAELQVWLLHTLLDALGYRLELLPEQVPPPTVTAA
jgi:hypothetical protein